MKKPIIGITPDFLEKSTYSNYPHYILRQNYLNAVHKFDAIPLLLNFDMSLDYIFNTIDGLLITGGDFDIDPSYYGEQIKSDRIVLNNKRTEFEKSIFLKAYEKNLPILGICGGEQLINVLLGGSLIQHISDEVLSNIDHEQKTPKHEPSHSIRVMRTSILYDITKNVEFMVNSTHHQAVRDLGKDVIISAIAPDGVVEAIESTKHRFCLGVQWHPEYLATKEDNLIFEKFIDAARQ